MKKGFTATIIFQADSLNYGEGIGNISELKKINRGNGNTHTFASRQSLRYDIVRIGNMLFDWELGPVEKKGKKGTIQFKKDSSIKSSQEMDLFGYMKTASQSKTETRSAPVRLSHAISLEPYRSDMDFLNNKGLADRIGENPNLANIEQHQSFYTYTITIDLDKVGKDGDTEIDNEERARRVKQLLTILKVLNRNIRGRQENLSPLFIIGGIYDIPNPFFQGRVNVKVKGDKYYINTETIKSTTEFTLLDKTIEQDTFIGIVDGIFENKDELEKTLPKRVLTIEDFFKTIETKVNEVYKK